MVIVICESCNTIEQWKWCGGSDSAGNYLCTLSESNLNRTSHKPAAEYVIREYVYMGLPLLDTS